MIPTKEQMSEALIKRYGSTLYEKISSATVAVCGLGGLGSNICLALARAGIGRLILIDYDKVDISNLHRQQYKTNQIGQYKTEAMAANLLEIAPYTEVQTHTTRITSDNVPTLLSQADIICEAFDVAEEKAMLVNTVLEQLPDKYLVAGSGMAGFGDANLVHTRRITKRFYLCGDEQSDVTDNIGLVSSRVMLCASHQAHMVIRLLWEDIM